LLIFRGKPRSAAKDALFLRSF